MPHSSLSFAHQKGVSGSNGGGNGRIELPGDEEEAWNAQSFLHGSSTKPRSRLHFKVLEDKLRTELRRTPEHAATAVRAIPAVLLGSLLNILDGVSCECIFPFTFILFLVRSLYFLLFDTALTGRVPEMKRWAGVGFARPSILLGKLRMFLLQLLHPVLLESSSTF